MQLISKLKPGDIESNDFLISSIYLFTCKKVFVSSNVRQNCNYSQAACSQYA